MYRWPFYIDLHPCCSSSNLRSRATSKCLPVATASRWLHTFFHSTDRRSQEPDPVPVLQIAELLHLSHSIYCTDLFAAFPYSLLNPAGMLPTSLFPSGAF